MVVPQTPCTAEVCVIPYLGLNEITSFWINLETVPEILQEKLFVTTGRPFN